MLAAFLIALCLCIVLGVYALRVAGERNRLRWSIPHDITIVWGPDFANDSARARQARAAKIVADARKPRRRK